MTRSLQETFRAVIQNDFYTAEDGADEYEQPAMCTALLKAKYYALITSHEYNLALHAIELYMKELRKNSCSDEPYLSYLLEDNELCFDPASRRAIYLNWNDRPEPQVRN